MDERVTTAARPLLKSVDPATGKPLRTYEGHTREEALAIIERTHAAWLGWRRTSFADRAKPMKKAADVLRKRSEEFAALMTAEMGKTVTEARAEVEKCAGNCEYFAKHAEAYLEKRKVDLGGPKAFVTFNPLGVVLAIMPWNFPFWQVFRFAAPTLMAGNGAVLKHASNVSGSALAIEDVFHEAGLPEDLFRTVLVPGRETRPLIEAPLIAAVTLTGSVGAGREVATAAGSVLKKTVLELGGSDAYLVLEDADIARAAEIAAAARMVNGGQSCIAGKRFIVVEKVAAKFEKAMASKMASYAMGDPKDAATKLGPMQSVAARDAVHAQVERSVAQGARLLCGGEVPERDGAWYPATVLADVRPGMAAYDEEVFGPVAAIIKAKDETDAIEIANASEFGLGSGVITKDLKRGKRIAAEELEAGMSFVNAPVRSDSRMPFGGVKHSGYGRECSEFGILEFVNVKSVLVQAL
jgi:succinate-semialdehyde dehydrogenase/glutarate-semialdehyde dehydrogenase